MPLEPAVGKALGRAHQARHSSGLWNGQAEALHSQGPDGASGSRRDSVSAHHTAGTTKAWAGAHSFLNQGLPPCLLQHHLRPGGFAPQTLSWMTHPPLQQTYPSTEARAWLYVRA